MKLHSGTSRIKTSTRGRIQPVTLSILGDQVVDFTELFQTHGFSQVKKHWHPAFQVYPFLNLNFWQAFSAVFFSMTTLTQSNIFHL